LQSGRPSDAAAEVTRVLEKILKDARAIDTEALCIMSGSKAWSVRLDVHVLDDAGNLLDAASMAGMASLLHFRKSDITIIGTDVVVRFSWVPYIATIWRVDTA
jgi:exosome complex component RRP45